MNVGEAIRKELSEVAMMNGVTHEIRVCLSAIPNTVTAVEIDLERFIPSQLPSRKPYEILIHPEDYARLLVEKDSVGDYVVQCVGEIHMLYGVQIHLKRECEDA